MRILRNPRNNFSETFIPGFEDFFSATTGQSDESHDIDEITRLSFGHYFEPVSREQSDPALRFYRLLSDWLEATEILSDTDKMSMHPAYQQIIGMGSPVLPYIFADLTENPGRWFWALNAITGCNPVLDEHLGQDELMARDWRKWAAENGLK